MKTLTIVAVVAFAAALAIATVPLSTITAHAAGGRCHDSRGSYGCNPGTEPFGGFVCNRAQCHPLPNG